MASSVGGPPGCDWSSVDILWPIQVIFFAIPPRRGRQCGRKEEISQIREFYSVIYVFQLESGTQKRPKPVFFSKIPDFVLFGKNNFNQ